MIRLRTTLILLSLSLSVAAAGLLGGCAGAGPKPVAELPSPAPLSLMPADQKSAAIAPSFPPQVPVPAGTIEKGRAQGDSAWDYTMVVQGNPQSVREWYREAYRRADWSVVAETSTSLSFVKHAAQSRVAFSPGEGATTRVVASVGVGTPVLELQ